MLELLGLSPLPEAGEAEAVVAGRHDPEPGLGLWLLDDDLHADAARLVLRLGDRERVLHVRLKLVHASLEKSSPVFLYFIQ